MTWQISSDSSRSTEDYAEKLGKQLRGGEIISLVSDLGGGKTTFARGLARGIGSKDHVSSPTFTISKLYKGADLNINHFDFYRLGDPGLVQNELLDFIDSDNVVVIEWPDIVENVLPVNRLTINIESFGDNERRISFSCPIELGYLKV